MRRLLLLVDSRSYIRSNCYQHQLAETLARCYRVRMISAREIRFAPLVRLAAYDRVLSVLRLRTLVRLAGSLARMLGDRVLYVYEHEVAGLHRRFPVQRGLSAARRAAQHRGIPRHVTLVARLRGGGWPPGEVRADGDAARVL